MQKLKEIWDEDPVTISFIGGAAAIVLIAVTAVFSGGPPPEPVPPPIVEIVPEPHVLTKSDLKWDLLERWPGAQQEEEPAVDTAALEEDEPAPVRRRHHRHWRRW